MNGGTISDVSGYAAYGIYQSRTASSSCMEINNGKIFNFTSNGSTNYALFQYFESYTLVINSGYIMHMIRESDITVNSGYFDSTAYSNISNQ